MKKKVYLRIPGVADCGVGYYRMWQPMEVARKKGEVDFKCDEFTWGERGDESVNPRKEPTVENVGKQVKWADVAYFARNDVPGYLAEAGGLRDFYLKPTILDIDDNVHATRPYNPGYRCFHPNSENLAYNIKGLGIFDAITVSTENLKKFYAQYTDNPIYVCPNSMDFEERDKILKKKFTSELYKKGKDEIRIGWSGSASHWENLKHIEKPLIEILKKYPNTTFYYTGLFGDLFKDPEIKDRVKSVGWSGLKQWPERNKEMNFDIALAPLTDNDFNRAKSNLRVLEYATAQFPVIASPVEPYNCFTDKEVIFAKEKDEWFDAIESLVLDEKKRKVLADNLYKRCKKDFNINKNYKIWLKAINKVTKDFKKNIK